MPDLDQIYRSGSITLTGGDGRRRVFPYRLMTPEATGEPQVHPLVVFLHGAGQRGDDNRQQLAYLPEIMADEAHRRQFPCFLLAPQCPLEKQWVDTPWSALGAEPMRDEPTEPLQAVMQMLDLVLDEFPIDRRRIYLTGISMGGYGVWELAMRRPELFAAAAPICGGGDESQAGRIAHLPIWAWHGDADDAVPVERSRRMIAALREAGATPKYAELAGVGHHSWLPAYEDPQGVVPWMFEQERRAV